MNENHLMKGNENQVRRQSLCLPDARREIAETITIPIVPLLLLLFVGINGIAAAGGKRRSQIMMKLLDIEFISSCC